MSTLTPIRRATVTALSLLILSFNAALAACPTAEWVCSFYPPVLGYEASPTSWCEGPDCFDRAYGDESTIVAADDFLFPLK